MVENFIKCYYREHTLNDTGNHIQVIKKKVSETFSIQVQNYKKLCLDLEEDLGAFQAL